MNLSPEAFERVLTELADRADAHPVADRVPAVRARARRNARRRAGVVAAALTVLIVMASGAAGFGGLPLLRGQGAGPAKKLNPPGPYLLAQLVRDEKREATLSPRVSGGRVVVINVSLRGRVPRWSGYQAGGDVRDNLWEALLIADGGDTTVNVRPTKLDFHCDPAAPLVDIDISFPVTLNYRPDVATPMLGRHDLRFTASACAPVGLVQQKLTIVVK
jgi:hypothetical protein